jgi:hypothetical protein
MPKNAIKKTRQKKPQKLGLVGMCAPKLPLWQLRGINCHFGNLEEKALCIAGFRTRSGNFFFRENGG